jgi:predicted acetyltransferase
MFLGGAMAIDKLQSHLASQVIGAMMTVEEQKLYLDFGYETFAEFLTKVRSSRPIQKRNSTNCASFTSPKARHGSTSSPIGNFH